MEHKFFIKKFKFYFHLLRRMQLSELIASEIFVYLKNYNPLKLIILEVKVPLQAVGYLDKDLASESVDDW